MSRGQPPDEAPRPARAGPSLKARAVRLLARREHSRIEMRRKLAAHAESPDQLETVLDELERADLLSPVRFVEAVVQRRADRFGARRIEAELDQHRLDPQLVSGAIGALRGTERERALAVWRKRFGSIPGDASERARQQRFLAQRGFDGDTISWLFRHGVSLDPDEPPVD